MKSKLKTKLEITKRAKDAIRQGWAWPGGYPLSIICNDSAVLCPSCARENWQQIAHDTIKGWKTGWDIADVEILWEGGNHCEQCSACVDAYPSEEMEAQP